mmetsp:Transcript_135200/g.376681  ORF Transcript_135200/g.376681 Transcript_135200/m.376681 type:complete len:140 (-) Transcript_135200:11-430(-)
MTLPSHSLQIPQATMLSPTKPYQSHGMTITCANGYEAVVHAASQCPGCRRQTWDRTWICHVAGGPAKSKLPSPADAPSKCLTHASIRESSPCCGIIRLFGRCRPSNSECVPLATSDRKEPPMRGDFPQRPPLWPLASSL